MDKEKEIEAKKLAKVMCLGCSQKDDCKPDYDCVVYNPARRAVEAGYRLCSGENCPNFKHYESECEKCTDKQEFITGLQIESAKEQAVREFAEKLKKEVRSKVFKFNRCTDFIFIPNRRAHKGALRRGC